MNDHQTEKYLKESYDEWKEETHKHKKLTFNEFINKLNE